jgi:hypothetical protein
MSRLLTAATCALLLAILGTGRAAAQDVEQDTTAQDVEQDTTAQDARAAWTVPVKVAHELEGRSECLMCHAGGVQEAPAVPVSHVDRTNETCMWCHAPDADVQTTAPPAIIHQMEGRSRCLMCHLSETLKEVPQVPANHAGRTEGFCTLCHAPDEKG